MVRIRLRRVGSANQPSYRIVIADKESPRDGRFIEVVGHYNPRTEPSTIVIDEDRVYYWLGVGAQPSDSVQMIFTTVNLNERYERFKAGVEKETLIAEAESLYKNRVKDPRTTRPVEKA